ncbi:SDR family oxidoreductase [Sphingobium yanoikuyae]|uniref:Short-chain dehydrogenase/reductase n=1 Tax=Sphingobium yanoikuyae TaxID=13690 RepID=A0A291MY27_SPHYA|nr:SDR family oxidoreductase [Sphingobium yanoikuyae]ATI79996.1 short-chain dehydrogenase/reductase [Sphingobium yanoikuyae]
MQTWFITGVGSGLGRAIAEAALAKGDRVVGTTRKPADAKELAGRFPERFRGAILDVTDLASIGALVDEAFAAFGRVDVVVNNAGYGLFGAVEGLSSEQIRHQIDTNLIGPIEVTRAALPHLREQGAGRIVVISSYGGQATHPGASLYHASKWGVEGFFDSLAQEVASFGIGVTIVEPGGARTGFRKTAGERLGSDVEAYGGTPIGGLRAYLANPAAVPPGDPAKMAEAIVASAAIEPAPLRLVLGSDAQTILANTLAKRLADVEAQKESAGRTDAS